MPLAAVVKQFIEMTGRADFAADEAGARQARWLINAGQRTLENLQLTPRACARHWARLPAGCYYFIVPDLRVAREVWFVTEASRRQLAPAREDELRPGAADLAGPREDAGLVPPINSVASVASQGRGTPTRWAPLTLQASPDANQWQTRLDFRGGMGGALLGSPWHQGGIVLDRATDAPGTFEVVGWFYPPQLVQDCDCSFWTEQYPEILSWAAAYHLEVSYRNREGARDWLEAIQTALNGLDRELVMQDLALASGQMKG
jgi:hypothetical protein